MLQLHAFLREFNVPPLELEFLNPIADRLVSQVVARAIAPPITAPAKMPTQR